MRDYIINFWVWWFLVKVPEWGRLVVGRIIFTLEYTNTLTMARNLTVPLFQDDSGMGKVLSFLIRGVWVWWGGMFTVVIAIPLGLLFGLLTISPFLILGEIIWGISRII